MRGFDKAFRYFQDVISEVVICTTGQIEEPNFGYDLSPLVLPETNEEDSENWTGIQYVYETSLNPPTRMQIVAGDERAAVPTLEAEELLGVNKLDFPDFRREWLNEFRKHPDALVSRQMFYLSYFLDKDGFQCRGIDWTQMLLNEKDKNVFSGIEGFFFPMLHFYEPNEKWGCVVRCEPIVEINKQ